MSLRIGALFAGYGGLDMAVMDVLDAELAWYAEFDKAPAKVMAHHHPDVPNLWDVTKVDWASVEPVDIITGGSPCQDLSHAGKRKGMTDGTRSNLWAEMREAIAAHRPRLVVWENVRGALSASADSDMEPCPRCVGGAHDRGPVLRALGRVLGDLAELGYDSRWYGLRAADVGGAHGRFRIFLFATPAEDTAGVGRHQGVDQRLGRGPSGIGSTAVPHPADRGPYEGDRLILLPTPAVNDMGEGKEVDAWDEWTDRMRAAHGNGNGHGKSLAIEAQRLMPTPRSTRGGSGTETMYGLGGERTDEDRPQGEVTLEDLQDWRQYEAAIRRAEIATGRPAPPPTELGPKGKPRLSPALVEWMMMLPAGHVTHPAIGLTRNEQLKALGNGVVPAQAAAALRAYIADEKAVAA